MEYAHREDVAHHDLKPSNILLKTDNQPVLTDFGLACFLDLESREVMRLPLPEACENLVFSPDGQKLAVTTCPRGGAE